MPGKDGTIIREVRCEDVTHANRPMRRTKQQLPEQQAWNLLRAHLAGVLSVVDANGEPYGVPLNYTVMGSDIVFHGALEGRKIDAIRAGSRGSLCVVAQDIPVAETFSNDYVSVIAEGPLEVVSDEDARHDLLMALGTSVNPDPEACKAEVASGIAHCAVFVLHVEHISAKESLALSRRRRMESAR